MKGMVVCVVLRLSELSTTRCTVLATTSPEGSQ